MIKRIIYSSLIFILCLFTVNVFKQVNASISEYDFSLFCYILIMDFILSIKNAVIYFAPGILIMEYIYHKSNRLFFIIPFLTYSALFFYFLRNDFCLYLNALYFEKLAVLIAEGIIPVIISLIIVYRKHKKSAHIPC